MLTQDNFHPYQDTAYDHVLSEPMSMLFLDMGLGKTPVTLHAIMERFDLLQLSGVLVVAPLRVCQTVWRQEAVKWARTKGLKFSLIHGDETARRRALATPANVYLTNFENLKWLSEEILGRYISRGKYPPFNMLVLDEISKMKNTRVQSGAERGQALLKLLPYFPYRMGLTGTPASNGLQDLFGQYLCIDSGQRLGTGFEAFKKKYFALDSWGSKRVVPRVGTEEAIRDRVGDITISMEADDYLNVPPFVFKDIWLDLPPNLRKRYDRIEKDMMVELDSGNSVEVFNAASLSNRCLQFAAGAIYTTPGEPAFETIHRLRLDAMADVVEEAAGEPVLVAFQFQHDAKRLLKDRRFKGFKWFSAKLSEKEANQLIEDWIQGRLPGIVGHPGSMGHGIDRLQHGGRIVAWMGLPWKFDDYSQTNARIRRQGQTKPVLVPRIMVRDTVDEAVALALVRKEGDELGVRRAIKDYWDARQRGEHLV